MGLRHEDGSPEAAGARVVDAAGERPRPELEAEVVRVLVAVGEVGRVHSVLLSRHALDRIPAVVGELDGPAEVVGKELHGGVRHVGREEVTHASNVAALSRKEVGGGAVVPGRDFSQAVQVVRSGEHVEDAVPPVGAVPAVVEAELVHDARNGNVEVVNELGRTQDRVLVAVEKNFAGPEKK